MKKPVNLIKLHLTLKAAGLFKYVWPFSGHQALSQNNMHG